MKLVYAIFCLILLTCTSLAKQIPLSHTYVDFIAEHSSTSVNLYESQKDDIDIRRIVKFGYNLDLDTGVAEDVWSYGGSFTAPTELSPDTLSIVSSAAADDYGSGYSGAQTVIVTGIGSGGQEISETVTLNGTAAVVSTNSYLFVNELKVTSGSGFTNAGNITISQTTNTTILSYIPTGYGADQQAFYRVPTSRLCHIEYLQAYSEKLSGSNPRVTLLIHIFDYSANTEFVIRRLILDTDGDSKHTYTNFSDIVLEARDRISVEMNSDSDNTSGYALFSLICREI